MPEQTRRTFLRAAGLGVAAVGAAAALPEAAHAAAHPAAAPARPARPSGPEHADDAAVAAGALVAYVGDVRSGRITVMAGDREVVVTDRSLARRLAAAVH